MNTFVALLRAVNVGGTGKLEMDELKLHCRAVGFVEPRTYIASGNVVFGTKLPGEEARLLLENKLQAATGRDIGVVIRTHEELVGVLQDNPFPAAAGNRLIVIFFDQPLRADCLDDIRHCKDEQLARREREIYVHYDQGMAASKLVIPVSKHGTGRNLNTVAKLIEMAAGR
jgi:uncharacterized protein (DUF1697 family)